MKLKVEHITMFEYDAPIYETSTEVRLFPTDNHGSPQRCLSFTLLIDPGANIFHYTDYYGNVVHHFNLLQIHKKVGITATSIVETGPGEVVADPDEEIMLYEFLGESKYVHFDPAVRQFANQFAEHEAVYNKAEAICRRINQAFVYEPGVTDVYSTSAVVMALGRGVCQDFAHVMIAVCRSLGLPTRYISGYLYGGPQTEEHDRASHAWCEVYCGPEKGWIAFDPTHDTLLVDGRYIRIGSGRDYADVSPVRGTFKGNAKENLKVTVRVTAVNND